MASDLFSAFLILVAVGVGFVYLKDDLNTEDPLARVRATALLQLRRFKLEGATPELSMNGRSVEILKDVEDIQHSDYGPPELRAIHYYVRNPHGEYFYVLIRLPDKPFGKHITHGAARAVLKDKYGPPGARSA